MSRVRAISSPDLLPSSLNDHTNHNQNIQDRPDDLSLEGVSTNIKLLLKLIQDHNEACAKDINDERKLQRVAGMMTNILDDVKFRIQKCQTLSKKREAELRRCNTDLRPGHVPRDKKPTEAGGEEKQKMKKELNASLAAQKSLEIMCSSLGKEKEIMATELARKVQELSGTEELVNDLKAQNEMLLEKEMKPSKIVTRRSSEKLLKSIDGYRSLKRKLKEAQEENAGLHMTLEEVGVDVAAGLDQIRSFRQRIITGNEQAVDIEEEMSALAHMFERFEIKATKHRQKKSECVKPKVVIKASSPSVLA
uniref:Uncharacterized protein n=1 Tax=Vitis vinifera TaxID=29760 RepID=A5AT79_VITVI|nr:hypothetical protein VITISV_016808 [Vitis vinifera]